jgi:hypothetical protein
MQITWIYLLYFHHRCRELVWSFVSYHCYSWLRRGNKYFCKECGPDVILILLYIPCRYMCQIQDSGGKVTSRPPHIPSSWSKGISEQWQKMKWHREALLNLTCKSKLIFLLTLVLVTKHYNVQHYWLLG